SRTGMDNKPPTIAIPVHSDKKLINLSKLITAQASCCYKLLETIVDKTVLVNENPPKTNTIIIVINYDVDYKKRKVVQKLTERNVTTMFNTYKGPLLSTSIPPMKPKIMTHIVPGKIITLTISAVYRWSTSFII